MTTKQVLGKVREAISNHEGDERDLCEQLDAEAEGWRMRLEELDAEEE